MEKEVCVCSHGCCMDISPNTHYAKDRALALPQSASLSELQTMFLRGGTTLKLGLIANCPGDCERQIHSVRII